MKTVIPPKHLLKSWTDEQLEDYIDDVARSIYEIGAGHMFGEDLLAMKIKLEGLLRIAMQEIKER